MHPEATRLIAEYRMQPHPEGGYYRETFRSKDRVTTTRGTTRSALTSIVFLLTGEAFSAFHRLSSDEVWHFYRGSPLAVEIIDAAGRAERRMLSADGPFQTAVAAGAHFGSHVLDPEGYAFVGCDVAPGFEFADFNLATRSVLMLAYPQHAPLIVSLTR